jgi:hypothetical protein
MGAGEKKMKRKELVIGAGVFVAVCAVASTAVIVSSMERATATTSIHRVARFAPYGHGYLAESEDQCGFDSIWSREPATIAQGKEHCRRTALIMKDKDPQNHPYTIPTGCGSSGLGIQNKPLRVHSALFTAIGDQPLRDAVLQPTTDDTNTTNPDLKAGYNLQVHKGVAHGNECENCQDRRLCTVRRNDLLADGKTKCASNQIPNPNADGNGFKWTSCVACGGYMQPACNSSVNFMRLDQIPQYVSEAACQDPASYANSSCNVRCLLDRCNALFRVFAMDTYSPHLN